jgi:hypothetical protein
VDGETGDEEIAGGIRSAGKGCGRKFSAMISIKMRVFALKRQVLQAVIHLQSEERGLRLRSSQVLCFLIGFVVKAATVSAHFGVGLDSVVARASSG